MALAANGPVARMPGGPAIGRDAQLRRRWGKPAGVGHLSGFIEASLRQTVGGCATSPVGYIEGIFVKPDYRRRGVGRALVAAAEEWAASRGCTEMASDCLFDTSTILPASSFTANCDTASQSALSIFGARL